MDLVEIKARDPDIMMLCFYTTFVIVFVFVFDLKIALWFDVHWDRDKIQGS